MVKHASFSIWKPHKKYFSPYLKEFFRVPPSAEFFYCKDAQANIVELLDNTGAIVVKYKYDAWGKCNTFAFDGIFWDQAGKFGIWFGYGMSALQVFNMGKAIFTQPNFRNSKWILY